MDNMNATARWRITNSSFYRSESQTDMFRLELQAELVDLDELQYVVSPSPKKYLSNNMLVIGRSFWHWLHRILAELDSNDCSDPGVSWPD